MGAAQFQEPAAQRRVFGAKCGHFICQIAIAPQGHVQFGTQGCRRGRLRIGSSARLSLCPAFFDDAAQFGVLVQETGRYRGGAGDGNECDGFASVFEFDEGTPGSGLGGIAAGCGGCGHVNDG